MILLNCGVGEESWESLGLQGDKTKGDPKGNQSWIFIGRTDAEAETPIVWPPDEKNQLIVNDSDAGKDWRQEEKGMTEDEIVGWHHRPMSTDHVHRTMDMSLSKFRELVMDRKARRAAIHGVTKSQTRLSDWTEHIPFSSTLYNYDFWKYPHEVVRHMAENTLSNTEKR